MWTRKLEICFAAVGLLIAVTLAGCVVDGEHKARDEIQSSRPADASSCEGLDQQACFENPDCVQIWRLPADCENAELCDFEFVECSDKGQGCGLPGLPPCPDEF
jgi:hypothetical protein